MQAPSAESAIYCRRCGYALVGLSANRCPECRREFDPADRRTFDRSGRSYLWRRWRRRADGALVLAVLLGGIFIAGRAIWVYQRYHAGWQAEQDAIAAMKAAGADVAHTRRRLRGSLPFELPWLICPFDYLRNRVLVIGVCDVPGPAFDMVHVGAFRECEYLWLVNLRITDDQLRHLQGMAKLKDLDLSDNAAVTDDGLVHLAGLASLRGLYLGGTSVSGAGLRHLHAMTGLERFNLGRTQVRGPDLALLARFPSLALLKLDELPISDADLAHLRGLPLRDISLRKTGITDAGLAEVARIASLEHLDVSSTAITDAGLQHVSKMPNLSALVLDNTAVTDAGLKHLEGLTRLEGLTVRGTKVTPEGIEQLKRAIPSLRVSGP